MNKTGKKGILGAIGANARGIRGRIQQQRKERGKPAPFATGMANREENVGSLNEAGVRPKSDVGPGKHRASGEEAEGPMSRDHAAGKSPGRKGKKGGILKGEHVSRQKIAFQ